MVASASKAKVLQTPKKAQGEVDYKAKIDAVMEALTAKVTRGPAPLHPVPPAPCTSMALSLDCLGPLITDQQAGRGDGAQVQGTRGPRARDPLSPPVPAPAATSCCRVCPHLNHLTFCGRCGAPSARSAPHHCRQELKRKLESAEDSDIVEQGKATLKSVKKELRLLQKAEEEQGQGESARPLPQHLAPTPVLQNRAAPLTTRTSSHGRHHPVGAVAAMVERLGEAHDEALGEIEEREKHFAAVFGDGDDEILSSPGL